MMQLNNSSSTLLSALLGLAVLPLALVLYISYSTSRDSLEHEITAKLTAIGDSKTGRLEGYIGGLKREIRSIAESPGVSRAIGDLTASDPGSDDRGADFKRERSSYSAILAVISESFGYYDLVLTDPEGLVLAVENQSPLELGQQFFSDLNSEEIGNDLEALFAGGSSFLFDSAPGRSTDASSTYVAGAVRKDGRLVGIAVAELNRDSMFAVVNDYSNLGASGDVLIAGRRGGEMLILNKLRDSTELPRLDADSEIARVLEAASRGEKGSGIIQDHRGNQVFAVWRHAPSFDWAILVKQDHVEAMGPVRKLRMFNLGALSITLLLLAPAALVISRLITDPINRLSAATRTVAGGDFSSRVPVAGTSEVASLARDFNRMAELIAEFEEDMKQHAIDQRERDAQLHQAQKMEVVGQLTGGVAHDFNNLLFVISGNVEIVREKIDSDEQIQRLLDLVLTAAGRGADLTHRLLAFSRQQVLAPTVTNLNDFLSGVTDLLGRSLGEHIEINTKLAPDLWHCLADPSQVENALLNLAINARDAMPGGGNLTIETSNSHLSDEYAAAQADLEPGEYVLLTVTDTGEGIAPEHQEHIFEPFFTTKKIGDGSGLGLSMVYGFVKQSGGHMTVYSEVGEGTTFRIYLPRTLKALVAQPTPRAAAGVQAVPEATILVVEDDLDVRTLAVALLSDAGYEVLEASSGPAALELLKEGQHVDLLLSDVVLPGGMSGPEINAQLRRDRPELRVLFMSGYAEQAVADARRLGDGEAFLQKPFGKQDLLDKVREVLSKSVD